MLGLVVLPLLGETATQPILVSWSNVEHPRSGATRPKGGPRGSGSPPNIAILAGHGPSMRHQQANAGGSAQQRPERVEWQPEL